MSSGAAPHVFVVYSREGKKPDRRVRKFTQDLRLYGIDATFDEWIAPPGKTHTAEEEKVIASCDWVIIAATPSYAKKWMDSRAGMAWEVRCIRRRINKEQKQQKHTVIPFVLAGKRDDALPDSLAEIGSFEAGKGGKKYDEAVRACAAYLLDISVEKLPKVVHHKIDRVPEKAISLPRQTGKRPGRPSKSLRTRPPAITNPVDGMVIAAEVVSFTTLDAQTRADSVDTLWALHRAVTKELLPTVTMYSDNTTDGIVIGFGGGAEPRIVIEVAKELVKRFKEAIGQHLRVGIDFGTFDQMTKPPHEPCAVCREKGNEHCIWVFGESPNVARRVAGYAAEDQIAITYNALERWLNRGGQDEKRIIAKIVDPEIQLNNDWRSQGMQVQLGSRQPLVFWLLQLNANGIQIFVRSSKMRRFVEINRTIAVVLDSIERSVANYIVAFGGPNEEKTWPRVSLFAIDPYLETSDELLCHGYRAIRLLHGKSKAEYETYKLPGRTRYTTSGKGRGPAGTAFDTRKTFYLTGLPDPKRWERYKKELKSQAHLTDNQLKEFGRPARTFMSFPIILNGGSDTSEFQPMGSVCVDLMADISDIGENGHQIVEHLFAGFSTTLAALWMFRTHGQ